MINFPNLDPALQLKSTPPRIARGFLDRERLKLSRLELGGTQILALLAPRGFGKTSQLIQWRRDALAQGWLAFWYSLDAGDDPLRLIQGLTCSARISCGKRGFADPIVRWLEGCTDPHEAATGWLAEVANLAVDVVLLLDNADHLASETRSEVLSYLIGNAPANLHIVLTARPTSALKAGGALSTARVKYLTASDLHFRQEETLKVLSTVMGQQFKPEAGASLHELTDGWPLGVQLAVAGLHRSGDLEGLLATATEDIRHYFVDSLIDRQPAETVHLLVRIAQFDLIHPDLCSAVLGRDEAGKDLLRVQDETPILSRAEDSQWMRLHSIARDVLRERLMKLPQVERHAIALRASAWYVAHDLLEEAAEQSFLAGDVETAISQVENNIRHMLTQGRSAAVLAWYHRMHPDEIKRRPGFWAPAAWALAMSERHTEVQTLLDLILAQPQLTTAAKFEASLIACTAAAYADRIDVMAASLSKWPTPPPLAHADEVPIYWTAKAFMALYWGKPDQARLDFSRLADFDKSLVYSPMSYGFANYGTGLSYLWEGRCNLAEQVLRPALTRAEERMSRRNPLACMLAALLALATWECELGDDPASILAGRLVVLERHGLPNALMAAYKVLARIADKEGRQDQALSLLESLHAIGQTRGILRLQVVAKYELIRLHARHARAAMAQELCSQLDLLLTTHRTSIPEPFVLWMEMHAELARTHALLACDDATGARQAAELAANLAARIKRGGELAEIRLLHAEALRREGAAKAPIELSEALSLAEATGMLRLVHEYSKGRPEVLVQPKTTTNEKTKIASSIKLPKDDLVLGSGLLTPKECEVLTLVSRSLSNREIARAMDISEQTIKWHMKNLFSKLNAGSRKHAVARARMLGLVI